MSDKTAGSNPEQIYPSAAGVYMQRFSLVPENFPFYDRPSDIYLPKNVSAFVIENGMKGLQEHIAERLERVKAETEDRVESLKVSHPNLDPVAELARLSFIGGLIDMSEPSNR